MCLSGYCARYVVFQQSVDELDIKEVAEERRLGVMTDRQENGAIALVQAWAEATPVSHWVHSILRRCSFSDGLGLGGLETLIRSAVCCYFVLN